MHRGPWATPSFEAGRDHGLSHLLVARCAMVRPGRMPILAGVPPLKGGSYMELGVAGQAHGAKPHEKRTRFQVEDDGVARP